MLVSGRVLIESSFLSFKGTQLKRTVFVVFFRGYPLGFTNIAGWNIPMFNRKNIFNPGPFSIDMLVYRSVNIMLVPYTCRYPAAGQPCLVQCIVTIAIST